MPPEWKLLRKHGRMSGNNFIAMVVMILILLFIIMAVGPLITAF